MDESEVRDEPDLVQQQEIASEETNSTSEVITEAADDIKGHEAAEAEGEVTGSTEEKIEGKGKASHPSESGQAPAEGENQEPEQPSEEPSTDATEAGAATEATEAIWPETRVNPLFKHQRLEGLMAKRPKAEALQQQGVPVEVSMIPALTEVAD